VSKKAENTAVDNEIEKQVNKNQDVH